MEHNILARLGTVFVLLSCIISSFISNTFGQIGPPPIGPQWVVFNKAKGQIIDDRVNCLYTDDYGIV